MGKRVFSAPNVEQAVPHNSLKSNQNGTPSPKKLQYIKRWKTMLIQWVKTSEITWIFSMKEWRSLGPPPI
jgi:hypothetical protein